MRARKLQTLATEELSIKNLRALFRLLDEEGTGEISALEIRKGLQLLGFSEAADPVALSRVVGDIDDDNTGTITEVRTAQRALLARLYTHAHTRKES
jgi:Ca2+-binding EF-hand superfamily protein